MTAAVLRLPDIWTVIFEYFEVNSAIYIWKVLKLQRTLPADHYYWKHVIETTAPHMEDKQENLHDMFFRLGFYNPPYNYVNILVKIVARRKCNRSGCRQYFQECDGTACYFHPGRKGSRLSCCGASSFSSPGCKRAAYHDGEFYDHATSVELTNEEAALCAEAERCWGGGRHHNRK